MIHPVLERVYIAIILLAYLLLRKQPVDKEDRRQYRNGFVIIEFFLFFSIFDNFLAVNLFGFAIKLQYLFLLIYFLITSKFSFKIGSNTDQHSFRGIYLSLVSIFLLQILSSLWMTHVLGVHVRFILIFIQLSIIFILYSLLKRPGSKEILLENITLIGVISCVVGILEFLIQKFTGIKIPYPVVTRIVGETHPELLSRAFGFLFEPNWYGFSLMMFFFVYLIKAKKVDFGVVAIFGLAQMASGNKITLLAYLFCILWMVFRGKSLGSPMAKVLGIVFLVLFGVLITQVDLFKNILLDRFLVTITVFQEKSLEYIFNSYDRFAFIWYLAQGFIEKPWFGHGLNASLIIHHQLPWKELPISEIKGNMIAGSGVFRILFEQGIVGALFVIYFCRRLIKDTFKKKEAWLFLICFFMMTLFYDIWTGLHSIPIVFIVPLLFCLESKEFKSKDGKISHTN